MMYQKSVPIARTSPTKLRTQKVATKLAKPLKVIFIVSEYSFLIYSVPFPQRCYPSGMQRRLSINYYSLQVV